MRTRFCLLALLACLALPAAAQTTHFVTVRNFEFFPSSLTINKDDTVVWTNEGGSHNIRETTVGTPAGFGIAVGSGWTYSFTFETAGEYTYDCELHPELMMGSVTVVDPTAAEGPAPAVFTLEAAYPNPFRTATAFALTLAQPQRVRVSAYDGAGREVALLYDGPLAAGVAVPFEWTPEGLATGVYVLRIEGETFRTTRRVVHVR